MTFISSKFIIEVYFVELLLKVIARFKKNSKIVYFAFSLRVELRAPIQLRARLPSGKQVSGFCTTLNLIILISKLNYSAQVDTYQPLITHFDHRFSFIAQKLIIIKCKALKKLFSLGCIVDIHIRKL